jgi:NADPH:quinone reductase-like Zn-dependent oxidoreductase
MRAVVITKKGGPSVLQVQERPDPPAPGKDRIRIAVRAAGVNFADALYRVGLNPVAPEIPFVPGFDVAGVVEEVGEGVDTALLGRRVFGGTRYGGYAEIADVGADDVAVLPDDLSFEQGGAIFTNYATAWEGLHGSGQLRPGQRVLVHAAAGGVGIAAVQLAKAAGAEVHGTASPTKHERLHELGVDRTIAYRQDRWWEGLPTYDVILEAIGGTSLRRSYGLLRPGGRVITYGASSLLQGERRSYRTMLPQALAMMRGFNLLKQLDESKTVVGLNIMGLWDERGSLSPWLKPLASKLADGSIEPVVYAAVPFAEAPEAHRILAARENFGKVVLTP